MTVTKVLLGSVGLFKNINYSKRAGNISGFTVIELGIFVAVFGLLISVALNEYSQYKKQKAVFDTKARSGVVARAMSAFVGNFGRLPCPADPTLAPTNPSAGLERCVAAAENIYPANNGAVVRVRGFRDTDGANGLDPVLIGSVPYVTLGITHTDTIDGWGSKFTYAVSEIMTDSGRYDDDGGVIQKLFRSTVDPDNAPAGPSPNDGGAIYPERAKLSYGDVTNAFLIALVSHGPDRRGGYNYYGNLIAPCDTVTPSLDSENCDGDASFLSAEPTTGIYNLVAGSLYFDDAITVFTINRDGDKWSYSSSSSIKNKTGGNVGIGKQPEFKLDVNGNIAVGDGSSSRYFANKYCNLPVDINSDGDYRDINEHNCFRPRVIAGSGIKCSIGLMTGIAYSNVKCIKNVDPTSIATGNCPAGQYIIGITSGGGLICSP